MVDRIPGHRLLIALFAIYLALLVWIILWKIEVPWVGNGRLRWVVLVPFSPGVNPPLELLANVLFFVPFGVYLGLLAPRMRWWIALAILAASSAALELAQFALAVGTSDVTDIVTNSTGGLIGLGMVSLARRRLGDRTPPVFARICLVGTIVLAFAVTAFFVSPLHFSQRERGLGDFPAIPSSATVDTNYSAMHNSP